MDEDIDLEPNKKEDNNEVETESTKSEKEESNNEINVKEKEVEDTSDKEEVVDQVNEEAEVVEEEEPMAIFVEGWFDEKTGKIDESKITNEEVLNAIKSMQTVYENEKNQRLISDGINNELSNYSLNVSHDTLLKVLDTTGVKIDKDGKVVGAKEAIEQLKTAEPGFFKDKEKESNPLNEGFNPVTKSNTENINSFSQAFRLMEEVN